MLNRQRVKFWAPFPCGESMAQVEVRVALFLNNLEKDALNLGYKNAIIVSHGTTIRIIAMHLLREPFETLNDKKGTPKNCSMRHLKFNQKWQDEGTIFTPTI